MSALAQPRDASAGQKDTLCGRNRMRWATAAVPLAYFDRLDLVSHFWLLSLHYVKESLNHLVKEHCNQNEAGIDRNEYEGNPPGNLML
jgi:hypothetical protein